MTGARGQLGRELVAVLSAAGHTVGSAPRATCDVADADAVLRTIEGFGPDTVIHAAAMTDVDGCEAAPERAFAVNATGTGHVVEAAQRCGAHVLYVSTDYVFSGEKRGLYDEDDEPDPRGAYGRSKLAGEQLVPADATIVRTSWLSGQHGHNVVKTILRLAAADADLVFVDDQVGCPTFTADLAPMLWRLAEERRAGTFHVTNQRPVSWFELARETLVVAGYDPSRVRPVATADLHPARPAPRPANSALGDRALRAAGLGPMRDFAEPLAELVAALA